MKSSTLADGQPSRQPGAPALFGRTDHLIITAAFLSFVFSVVLWFGPFGTPNKDGGLFVSVWVPSILSLGCFTKLARKESHRG